MTTNEELDEQFIARQRQRLLELREELQEMTRGWRRTRPPAGRPRETPEHDPGDMSHQMFTREMDATVGLQARRRLEDVERALEKIEEGTYGVCDDTGEPIPRGRLEAMPEAIRTVEAQQRHDRTRRPPR